MTAAAPMEPLGFGVIGIGDIVKGTIAPAILADPRSSLVAAVSRDQGRADAFGAEFGVDFVTTDYDSMLGRDDVDAVFIATPNALHAQQAIAAARAGKHVFCDKPLATSVSDAYNVAQACEDAGVTLGLNFHYRHLPWVEDARNIIRSGQLGEIQTIEVDVGSGTRNYTNWRADPAMAGIGSVFNVGVHMLDVLSVILDAEPVAVSAMFDQAPGSGEVEMQALILITFDNGTLVYANCNEKAAYPRNTITIQGSEGRLIGENVTRSREEGTLHLLTKDTRSLTNDTQTATSYPPPGAHQLCLSQFVEAVLSGGQPRATGIDGLRSMQLCEAIAMSARSRRHVTVEPI
ncbi:MAG: 1,5-anhydro-D-fructose reductase (1,5-anhydro-D-mannitol-forming) [Verrucomicrobiales bacterium]|jgi:1,5-anhydro-D-fructose reductase (1,5-anhydro-D-mannitol-forming)